MMTGNQRWLFSPRISRLFVTAIFIMNYGLVILNLLAWGLAFQKDLLWRADFSNFYTGWSIVRDGRGAELYNFDLQARYQQEILAGRSFQDGLLPYVNPPGLPLLFTPLANLPLLLAFLVWTLGSLALLVWAITLINRFIADWKPIERWLCFGAVLAFPPMLISFLLGSFSLLMLVCILQVVLTMKRENQVITALWFFVGTIKPQIMLIPGAMLAGSRRWVTLAWLLVLVTAMIVITSLFFGWQIWLVYFRRIGEISGFFGKFGFYPESMVNFRGALTSLLGSDNGVLINRISMAALIIVIITTFVVWRKPLQSDQPEFELRIAFTLALALFFNIHLYLQDSLLYLAPAILFYDYLQRRGLPRRHYAAFVLLCPYVFVFSEFFLGNRLIIRGEMVAALVLLLSIGKAYISDESA